MRLSLRRCALAPSAVALLTWGVVALTPSGAQASVTHSYSCAAMSQTDTAPATAVSATVTLKGAAGGNGPGGANSGTGGKGADLTVTMPVTGDEQFTVDAGCAGANGTHPSASPRPEASTAAVTPASA